MGALRTRNTNLPTRMLARRRGDNIWYYYATKGADRKEIPLGNDLKKAIDRHRVLIGEEHVVNLPLPSNIEKEIFKNLKSRSVAKGIELGITVEDILLLLRESDYKCSVTKMKFNGTKYKDKRIRPWLPSVDRIDPLRGYTKDNIRIVCAAVNIAINDFGDDLFYSIISKIRK